MVRSVEEELLIASGNDDDDVMTGMETTCN